MNKHIQEIAMECASNIFWWNAGVPSDYTFNPDNLVKFAELLVKECAAEAHRRVCTDGNDNMLYANLLEHFGVKDE